MLHRLNPVRLGFLRDAIDAHWTADSRGVRPLAGKRALDVGCGAGLLAEPLARLGVERIISPSGLSPAASAAINEIGRASCRERV